MVDCPITLAIHPHDSVNTICIMKVLSKHVSQQCATGGFLPHRYSRFNYILTDPYLASCTARSDLNSGARKPGPVINNGPGSGYKKGKNGLKRGESEGENQVTASPSLFSLSSSLAFAIRDSFQEARTILAIEICRKRRHLLSLASHSGHQSGRHSVSHKRQIQDAR